MSEGAKRGRSLSRGSGGWSGRGGSGGWGLRGKGGVGVWEGRGGLSIESGYPERKYEISEGYSQHLSNSSLG